MTMVTRVRIIIRYARKRGLWATFNKVLQIISEKEVTRIFSILGVKSSNMQQSSSSIQIGKKWFLVANDLKWASNDYRGKNFCEAFDNLKVKYEYVDNFSYLADHEMQKRTSTLVLFRTDSQRTEYPSLKDSVEIVYDTDDLCFDRRYFNIKNVPGIGQTSVSNQEWLLGGSLDGQESIIKSAFMGTGPTKRITDSMYEIGAKNVLTLRNVLPSWMHQQARDFRKTPRKSIRGINILYASGSNTHQEDFAEALSGIFSFLSKNKESKLSILGFCPFNLKDIWSEISDQVVIYPKVKHKDLLEVHSRFDVAIAPLKLNEFTEGKSALKFVHAASLGIPCLATPSEPFRSAMAQEFSELLVRDNDWEKSLTMLIDSDIRDLSKRLIHVAERDWTLRNLENEMVQLFDVMDKQ